MTREQMETICHALPDDMGRKELTSLIYAILDAYDIGLEERVVILTIAIQMVTKAHLTQAEVAAVFERARKAGK